MDWLVPLGATIVGGALALLGGFVHEWWQFKRRRRAAARVVLDDLIRTVDEARLHTDDYGDDEPARPAEERDSMAVEMDTWSRFRDVLAATGNVDDFELIRQTFSDFERAAATRPRSVVRYELANDPDDLVVGAAGDKDAAALFGDDFDSAALVTPDDDGRIYFIAPVREEELEGVLPELERVAHLLGKWGGYARKRVDTMFNRTKPSLAPDDPSEDLLGG